MNISRVRTRRGGIWTGNARDLASIGPKQPVQTQAVDVCLRITKPMGEQWRCASHRSPPAQGLCLLMQPYTRAKSASRPPTLRPPVTERPMAACRAAAVAHEPTSPKAELIIDFVLAATDFFLPHGDCTLSRTQSPTARPFPVASRPGIAG